jgi:hypothetical protein
MARVMLPDFLSLTYQVQHPFIYVDLSSEKKTFIQLHSFQA